MKSIYRREFDMEGLKAYKFVKLFTCFTVILLVMLLLLIKFDYDYDSLSDLKYFISQENELMFQGESTLDVEEVRSISELLVRYRSWRVDIDIEAMLSDTSYDYPVSGYELYRSLLPNSVDELNDYLRSFIKSCASIDMVTAAESDVDTIEGLIELRRHEPGLIRTWQGFIYAHVMLIQYVISVLLGACLSAIGINVYVMRSHSWKVI